MSNGYRARQKSLAELLVQVGAVTQEEAQRAVEQVSDTDGDLAGALVAEGVLGEEALAEAVCNHLSLPFIHVDQYDVQPAAQELFPHDFLTANRFVVLDHYEGIVVVATSGVLSNEVLAEIEKQTGCQPQIYVTMVNDLRVVLNRMASATRTKPPRAPGKATGDEAAPAKTPTPQEEPMLEPHEVAAEEAGEPVEEERPTVAEQPSEEADELFADLQRDLERFNPSDSPGGSDDAER